ncbi:hypothetical protein ACODNH_01935 (plasmid) [Haloarcula sp. NS06]|uniref:hypothetical protein n=1 Tax=Haloarcula sp. NS06 TaxID=3409688 RepID=UPI003DA7A261
MGLGLTAAGLIITNTGIIGPNTTDPPHRFNTEYAKSYPETGHALGHHVMFDVYVTPEMGGAFTVWSQTDSGLTENLDVNLPYGKNGLALWKIRLNSYPHRDELSEEELPLADNKKIESGENYPAYIFEATHRGKRRVENQPPDRFQTQKKPILGILEPTPKPAIAGPLETDSLSNNTYSADKTILSSSHIAEFEWSKYRIVDGTWTDYLLELFFNLIFGEGIPSLAGFLDKETQREDPVYTSKFPQVDYNDTGRYLLELIVTDQNRRDAEQDSDIFGMAKTAELITVGGETPNPQITVVGADDSETPTETPTSTATPTDTPSDTDQPEDNLDAITRQGIARPIEPPGDTEGFTLTGFQSSPADQITNYGWLVLGPLPKSLLDVDLSDLDFELLFQLLGKLAEEMENSDRDSIWESLIQRDTGETIEIDEEPAADEFYLATLTVTTEIGAWATAFTPIKANQQSGWRAFDDSATPGVELNPDNAEVRISVDGSSFRAFPTALYDHPQQDLPLEATWRQVRLEREFKENNVRIGFTTGIEPPTFRGVNSISYIIEGKGEGEPQRFRGKKASQPINPLDWSDSHDFRITYDGSIAELYIDGASDPRVSLDIEQPPDASRLRGAISLEDDPDGSGGGTITLGEYIPPDSS